MYRQSLQSIKKIKISTKFKNIFSCGCDALNLTDFSAFRSQCTKNSKMALSYWFYAIIAQTVLYDFFTKSKGQCRREAKIVIKWANLNSYLIDNFGQKKAKTLFPKVVFAFDFLQKLRIFPRVETLVDYQKTIIHLYREDIKRRHLYYTIKGRDAQSFSDLIRLSGGPHKSVDAIILFISYFKACFSDNRYFASKNFLSNFCSTGFYARHWYASKNKIYAKKLLTRFNTLFGTHLSLGARIGRGFYLVFDVKDFLNRFLKKLPVSKIRAGVEKENNFPNQRKHRKKDEMKRLFNMIFSKKN